MPRYIVKEGHVKHAPAGAKEAKTYGPGEGIELTKAEADALGARVKSAPQTDKGGEGK